MGKWTVDDTEEYAVWFAGLDDDAKADIFAYVSVLAEFGPSLGRPYVDTLDRSAYKNMKELRPQSNGRPFRIAFAFDLKRTAILLIGGNKEGNDRFYEELISKADALYAEHVKKLEAKDEKGKSKTKQKRRKK